MPNTSDFSNAIVGSSEDVYARLIEQLAPWFGSAHPVLDTILQGYISAGVFNYQQLAYINLQMRLQTATDNNLNLISKDSVLCSLWYSTQVSYGIASLIK